MWNDRTKSMLSAVLGVAESNWVGKYQCKFYKDLKKRIYNKDINVIKGKL